MKFSTIIFYLCFLFFVNSLSHSQIIVLKVWPGKIPDAVENTSVKENTIITKTGAERVANVTEPTLSIYFPTNAKKNSSAVIICPGGGYGILAMPHEGNDIASWLNENGIVGIVLKYRLPDDAIMKNKMVGPLMDVQEAMRIVRKNAKNWNINPDKIGVLGFSAGGHLASTITTHFNDKIYEADTISARPDFSILIYPVISMNQEITHMGSRKNLLGEKPEQKFVDSFSNELQVTENTPPAFIVHAADDSSVPVQNSINYFLALERNKIPAELHVYEKGGHGFGLVKNSGTESGWPDACLAWLKAKGFL